MNQLLINYIPLGDTGNVCYLRDTLLDFDSQNLNLIQSRINELHSKKVYKLIILDHPPKDINVNSISSIFKTNGLEAFVFTGKNDLKSQVKFFEEVLDQNADGNICILFHEVSSILFELVIKLALYLNSETKTEEIFEYLTEKKLGSDEEKQFKEFVDFLENDPYLLTKPDRSDFNRTPLTQPIPEKILIAPQDNSKDTGITLNLNSLNLSIPDDEILPDTKELHFNLNSLVESDFKTEESPEEHYEKIRNTNTIEVEENLSLDVNLSEEIEYISSLGNLSDTLGKSTVINIDTVPLDTPTDSKTSSPTIDYKSKEFLDFDAIIQDELEHGKISGSINLETTDLLPDSLEIDDFIETEDVDLFSTKEETVINLDTMNSQVNIDLTFPPPLPDLDDLMDLDLELEQETKGEKENPVDPSQTFMIKRINDVIKKEVLNEDSADKISALEEIETKPVKFNPIEITNTDPKLSNPKITSPKFNPITLDD